MSHPTRPIFELNGTTGKAKNEKYFTAIHDAIIGRDLVFNKQRVLFEFIVGDKIVISKYVTIESKNKETIWFNHFYRLLYKEGTDGDYIWIMNKKQRFTIRVSSAKNIVKQKTKQSFRDGHTHCVLQPLINMFSGYLENAEKDSTKKRLSQIVRKLKSMLPLYELGVPENEMETVAKAISRRIIIKDLLNHDYMIFNAKSSKKVLFTNTRQNHLDFGLLTTDGKFESVTDKRMGELIDEHTRTGTFMLEIPQNGRIGAIRSIKGSWGVQNKDKELYDAFNETTGVCKYDLDAMAYPDLNEFIKEGRIINSAPVAFVEDYNNLKGCDMVDLAKAYTQHKRCKLYKGFPSKLTHYCHFVEPMESDFVKTHIGYFQVEITGFSGHKMDTVFRKLGIDIGKYILPSVEIEYLIEKGVTLVLLGGCWSRHTFDFDYTDEMLENRRYCTWAGKLGVEHKEDDYEFDGDEEWASHLKSELGDANVEYYTYGGYHTTEPVVKDGYYLDYIAKREDGDVYYYCKKRISIRIPKKYVYTRHHILGFITAYTRLNMYDIMENTDAEFVKIVMDGLYYRGSCVVDRYDVSYDKEKKEHKAVASGWYYTSDFDITQFPVYDKRFDPPPGVGYMVLTGAGGTGKSYSIYKNSNLISVRYVVASKALGEDKRTEFGCNFNTIHRVLGDISGSECVSLAEEGDHFGIGMMDEITQYDAPWINRALKMYPNTFWIIAGDVDYDRWYQCRSGCDGKQYRMWLPKRTDYVVHYEKDWRAKDCPVLIQLKADLRKFMAKCFTDGEIGDADKVSSWLRKRYPVVSKLEAFHMFQKGDVVISGRHKTNKLLLENGIVSGSQNPITKRVSWTAEEGNEVRGAFTIHSFQGFTIPDKRVFITLDLFEYSMLITAIGRVCRMEQLVFVE
jgi:hypothetical protein